LCPFLHPEANRTVLHKSSHSESGLAMQKFLPILAISALISAPASAAVILGGPETLSPTPFTFGPDAANQFSLRYPVSGFFNDTFVSTTGTAEAASVFGSPSVDFTDGRGGDVIYGPDQFGAYASFPTATDIPFSATDSFLGLRYTVGADTFYGFAQFAGPDLERFGFETTPNAAIDANAAIATPELSTWAMVGLGFVATALIAARRRRSFRLA
jgi:hypothetical protein